MEGVFWPLKGSFRGGRKDGPSEVVRETRGGCVLTSAPWSGTSHPPRLVLFSPPSVVPPGLRLLSP